MVICVCHSVRLNVFYFGPMGKSLELWVWRKCCRIWLCINVGYLLIIRHFYTIYWYLIWTISPEMESFLLLFCSCKVVEQRSWQELSNWQWHHPATQSKSQSPWQHAPGEVFFFNTCLKNILIILENCMNN